MKKLKQALLITSLGIMISGCAIFGTNSKFQTVAGKFLETSSLTVDGAMKGWASWVAAGKATDADQVTVKTYYVQYQTYLDVATNAYVVAVKTGDQSSWTSASNNVQATQNKLTAITANVNTK